MNADGEKLENYNLEIRYVSIFRINKFMLHVIITSIKNITHSFGVSKNVIHVTKI